MMRGVVRTVSAANGRVAIMTEHGDYCVLSCALPSECNVQVGDLLSGDLANPGSCLVAVGRTGRVLLVRMHACRANAVQMNALIAAT